MSEKIQIAIYRLATEHTVQRRGKEVTHEMNLAYVASHFKSQKGYKPQETVALPSLEFDLGLYFKRGLSPIQWKDFIETVATHDQPILNKADSVRESFVLLLQSKATGHVYAVTGGSGHMAIQDLLEHDFGIEVMSRLLTVDERALRSTKERNLTGALLGSIKFFRKDFNLLENEQFGAIYQGMLANLDKKKLAETFGLEESDFRSDAIIDAKNSFQIKKAINFQQLVEIVCHVEELMKKDPIVEINQVRKLNKKNVQKRAKLEEALDQQIESVIEGKNRIDIEICHRDLDLYSLAQTFELERVAKRNPILLQSVTKFGHLSQLVSLLSLELLDRGKAGFMDDLAKSQITTFNAEGQVVTAGKFRDHLVTEISYQAKSYFYLQGEWFEISDKFLDRLNRRCLAFANEHSYPKNLETWKLNQKTECAYNRSHANNSNTLVLDGILSDKMELCDILHWDEQQVYFIHVKRDFDRSMRDLTHQIWMAAERFAQDRTNALTYCMNVHASALKNRALGAYFEKYDEAAFMKILQKRPVFVAAIYDQTQLGITKDMAAFRSNIAKFALQNVARDMRGIDMDFQLAWIKGE